MSKKQCMNKKLHPYYKTGIYGWLGEEVDDNDYIICPICSNVLGMNYWDYDGDNKCPECEQELDYSEIYDFEDTCYFEQLLEIKESKIADLETKLAKNKKWLASNKGFLENQKLKQQLAEKEERINWLVEAEFNRKWAKKYVEMRRKEDPMLCLPDSDEVYERYFELKQQLEVKDRTITNLVEDNRASQEWYKKQLAEKEKKQERTNKVVEQFQQRVKYFSEQDQYKISFAVEQLEKVKECLKTITYLSKNREYWFVYQDDLLEQLDNQIKQLKEMK